MNILTFNPPSANIQKQTNTNICKNEISDIFSISVVLHINCFLMESSSKSGNIS